MLEAFICLPNLWEIMPTFYRIQDRFSSLTTTEVTPQNVEEFRSKYGHMTAELLRRPNGGIGCVEAFTCLPNLWEIIPAF